MGIEKNGGQSSDHRPEILPDTELIASVDRDKLARAEKFQKTDLPKGKRHGERGPIPRGHIWSAEKEREMGPIKQELKGMLGRVEDEGMDRYSVKDGLVGDGEDNTESYEKWREMTEEEKVRSEKHIPLESDKLLEDIERYPIKQGSIQMFDGVPYSYDIDLGFQPVEEEDKRASYVDTWGEGWALGKDGKYHKDNSVVQRRPYGDDGESEDDGHESDYIGEVSMSENHQPYRVDENGNYREIPREDLDNNYVDEDGKYWVRIGDSDRYRQVEEKDLKGTEKQWRQKGWSDEEGELPESPFDADHNRENFEGYDDDQRQGRRLTMTEEEDRQAVEDLSRWEGGAGNNEMEVPTTTSIPKGDNWVQRKSWDGDEWRYDGDEPSKRETSRWSVVKKLANGLVDLVRRRKSATRGNPHGDVQKQPNARYVPGVELDYGEDDESLSPLREGVIGKYDQKAREVLTEDASSAGLRPLAGENAKGGTTWALTEDAGLEKSNDSGWVGAENDNGDRSNANIPSSNFGNPEKGRHVATKHDSRQTHGSPRGHLSNKPRG